MHDDGKKDRFAGVREQMLNLDLKGRGITDPDVLRVMSEIRREEFVPEPYQSRAYADGPLPIGMDQTISQPYIVALMTQELRLDKNCEVLEIGTGSGYQTAVLSRLVKKVYTIERFSGLAESAKAVLEKLGVKNVQFHVGDGSCGWPEQKFFDRIMITAAVPRMPAPVFEQLVESGLMIVPVGFEGVQQLVICEKRKGQPIERVICDVRFVKLLGRYGFEE